MRQKYRQPGPFHNILSGLQAVWYATTSDKLSVFPNSDRTDTSSSYGKRPVHRGRSSQKKALYRRRPVNSASDGPASAGCYLSVPPGWADEGQGFVQVQSNNRSYLQSVHNTGSGSFASGNAHALQSMSDRVSAVPKKSQGRASNATRSIVQIIQSAFGTFPINLHVIVPN